MSRAELLIDPHHPQEVSDFNLRSLLDHVAVELAEEYIRLMEAAAMAAGDESQGAEDPS